MPGEWIELAKEGLKLATRPRYAFAIWCGCILMLAVPLPDFLLLEQFRTDHGQYIGVIFLFFFLLWCAEIILFLCAEPIRTYLDHREKLKHLDSLTNQEASVLSSAIGKNSQTVTCGINLNCQYSLIAKGLLQHVSTEGKSTPDKFYGTYHIPRFVWDHIKKDHIRKILEEKAKPTTEASAPAPK